MCFKKQWFAIFQKCVRFTLFFDHLITNVLVEGFSYQIVELKCDTHAHVRSYDLSNAPTLNCWFFNTVYDIFLIISEDPLQESISVLMQQYLNSSTQLSSTQLIIVIEGAASTHNTFTISLWILGITCFLSNMNTMIFYFGYFSKLVMCKFQTADNQSVDKLADTFWN